MGSQRIELNLTDIILRVAVVTVSRGDDCSATEQQAPSVCVECL